MQLYDLHTHSVLSDGEATVSELVAGAKAQGFSLGISDHLFAARMFTEAHVARYLDALEAYDVYRGVEANMCQDYRLPDALEKRVEYVITSVHAIPDGRGDLISLSLYFGTRCGEHKLYHKNYCSELNELYMEEILRQAEHTLSTQRCDIYGHPTVLPCYDELRGTAFLRDWENALFSLCKRYHVAMEISGLWRAPDVDVIVRAKAAGLTFAMGSDCHYIKDIGNLGYVREAIEAASLTEADFFVPKRG